MKHAVPESEWEWYGIAAHLCVGQWCRFHLATKVGRWIVSTVGEYIPPHVRAMSEAAEAKWLRENNLGEEVGCGRRYETMVFPAGARCVDANCACGATLPGDWSERDSAPYNDRKSATAGHLAMCRKWASIAECSVEGGAS